MKKKINVSVNSLRAFIAENPKLVGGNIKLMKGEVSLSFEDELVKLRKQTGNYKRNYKVIKEKT